MNLRWLRTIVNIACRKTKIKIWIEYCWLNKPKIKDWMEVDPKQRKLGLKIALITVYYKNLRLRIGLAPKNTWNYSFMC